MKDINESKWPPTKSISMQSKYLFVQNDTGQRHPRFGRKNLDYNGWKKIQNSFVKISKAIN